MNYFFHRIVFFLLTLAMSIIFSFLLLHIAPGDPVDLMLGDQAPPEQKEIFRHQLGLDQPLQNQFQFYLQGILSGNMGNSLIYQRPILDLLKERIPYTAQLALVAIVLTTTLGIGFGVLSSFASHLKPLSWGLLGISVLGQSTPNFFLGPLLILIFSIYLGWLPVSGTGSWVYMILPAMTLALNLFAIVSRMTTAGLIEEGRKDYFTTALAKGLSRLHALLKHALRNVSIPVANLLGLQLGALLTGAVVTEYIFDWPGIGSLFFAAIEKRDYPLIQSLILVYTSLFALINFGMDLLNGVLDPRVRIKTYEKA